MKLIRTYGKSAAEAETILRQIEERSGAATSRLEPAVKRILADIRRKGDAALRRYAERLDGLAPSSDMRVTQEEMAAAWDQTPKELRQSLRAAASNVRRFARWQMPKEWTRKLPGVQLGQRTLPLESVGCYVPGGRYPLPSTLLMTVVPAQVAGVKRIVVVSPRPARETLAAAHLAGVKEFYRIGGAQAIAALAYGTSSVPRVDKIVGPGNLYVTTAKKLVAFDCGIDMLAGPTEIVVASEDGNPCWIASDLVAQAEHDPEALAILVTSNLKLAQETAKEVRVQASSNKIASQSIARNGVIFVTKSTKDTATVTNRLAAEHLTLDQEDDLAWVHHAGSIFVGANTPQSMGDYISGPNHVLPTGRLARVRGGLSVYDFLRLVTTQEYTASGLATYGPHAERLATAEGLLGHAASVGIRSAARASRRTSR
ncbi:MAG TPA: histidinol dehydrogenase [Acidobacteriaceae bacterium]|nr:histidinol dehydrogenase [Acidobacteriaceae bacterium]